MKCYYCERLLGYGRLATVDHVIPKSYGGGNDAANLVDCCQECNTLKGNFLLYELRMRLCDKRFFNLIPNPELRARVPIIIQNIKNHRLYNMGPYSINQFSENSPYKE